MEVDMLDPDSSVHHHTSPPADTPPLPASSSFPPHSHTTSASPPPPTSNSHSSRASSTDRELSASGLDNEQPDGDNDDPAEENEPEGEPEPEENGQSSSEDEEDDEEDEDDDDEDVVVVAESLTVPPTKEEEVPMTIDLKPIEIPQLVASTLDATALPSSSSKPPSTATATAKPKVVKRRRSPSPSPPPPPAPLQTIRLTISLGGPENYEVNVSALAKQTGQRPATPPPPKHGGHSDSEAEDPKVKEGPETDKGGPKKKKRKAEKHEYYDLHDPFIDDSELAVDERTFFAQTKQQGFYVSSGEVALLKDKSPKKPKSRKAGVAGTPLASAGTNGTTVSKSLLPVNGKTPIGTRDSPIALLSDGEGEDGSGVKKKRYITVTEGGKKRKIVDITSFHPELQTAVDELKLVIAQENWETKGKFPPSVKPALAEVALKAVHFNEYDEHFFALMPTLFPYNKFTMTKLIKRTIFQEHTKILYDRQEVKLQQLQTLTKDGFEQAKEEYQKSLDLWTKKQEKLKAEAEVDAAAPGGVIGEIHLTDPEGTNTPRHPTAEADGGNGSGMDVDPPFPLSVSISTGGGAGKDGGKEKESNPPPQRYRLTEQMKLILWGLVMLSNEIVALANDKNLLEGSKVQVSEQSNRKVLYQKIIQAFPDGWMTSAQISREVSVMKKRIEKEAIMDQDS